MIKTPSSLLAPAGRVLPDLIFHRNLPIHKLFERSCDIGLLRLTPDKITQIFGFRMRQHLSNAGGTVGSRITADGARDVIECRRLDEVLDGPPPTIIKMDIEGAEPDAIRGATQTIRKTRPILAVCAYHKCDHLWTLPTLINTALSEYRIFLRRYAEECWETVYYAVPPERIRRHTGLRG